MTFTHDLGVGHLVNIDVSRDGGMTWTSVDTLTTTAATSGTYAWLVSGPSTTQARIRVSSASVAASDVSDVNFTIAAAITVTAPNSAVTWGAGSTRTIAWTHTLGAGQAVDIAFSPDNGATWIPMASGAPYSSATTGSYSGPLPSVVTTLGRVGVTWSTESSERDLSDGLATPAAPAVTVTAPNTNVSWLTGSAKNITWTHNLGMAARVLRSRSSRDGGAMSVGVRPRAARIRRTPLARSVGPSPGQPQPCCARADHVDNKWHGFRISETSISGLPQPIAVYCAEHGGPMWCWIQ